MDSRKVQRTNDMFYLYLPTKWCNLHTLTKNCRIGLKYNSDSSLTLYPAPKKSLKKKLIINAKEEWVEDLQKLVVAAYISPSDSFEIILAKNARFRSKLLKQNLLTPEFIELEKNVISCSTSFEVKDAKELFSALLRKIKNLLLIVAEGDNDDLIMRYEEEIDRSVLLIEKTVIKSLVNPIGREEPAIQLHFISGIAKELERMVDRIVEAKKLPNSLIKKLRLVLDRMQILLDSERLVNLNYLNVMSFVILLRSLPTVVVRNVKTYHIRRIVRSMNNIAELLIDWALVIESEK